MIKPYKILHIREESDGGQTVFFRVSKTEKIEGERYKTLTLESAVYVAPSENIDDTMLFTLKNSGWI
jgi:hypothetical protein